VLLDARGLDRYIAFDPMSGVLRCEAGVLLSEILDLTVPRGWFLPVTPGTKLVTVGGAIANDVHGKNHHRTGTFGCHVRQFELLRSDGTRLRCSPAENPEWYQATIGGLGLTGLILWTEIVLKPIANPYMDVETLRYGDLGQFFELSDVSDRDFEYTVCWIDCLARGRSLGRGLFMRANHAAALCPIRPRAPRRGLTVPFEPPASLVNGATLRPLNTLYYRRRLKRRERAIVHYEPFFYPLDGIGRWNRLYGPRGFLQYQCVVPSAGGAVFIREILSRIAAARSGSFLAVLKVFGHVVSPGLLSFPRPGITLALDFPNRGPKTFELLESLDEVVREAGGAVYPAKDARMSAQSFRQYFPKWEMLQHYRDPHFSSSFWRRVTEDRS
jgi:FAD/FMN-containing dehydrogenase